jgi:dihydroneopterin aldolase
MSEGWYSGERSYQVTELNDVMIRAKVGAAAFEQHPGHFQRLLVSASLFRHGGPNPAQRLEQCMDYDHIYQFILSWEQRPHSDLLEPLAEDLVAVCFRDPSVEACRVSLKKPDIFHNAASAGITLYRRRAEQSS